MKIVIILYSLGNNDMLNTDTIFFPNIFNLWLDTKDQLYRLGQYTHTCTKDPHILFYNEINDLPKTTQ